ncbi:thioesterase II family protein [Pelistega indica]|nr:alpha/beta fold hydrolase [Pelistega indica]
MSTTYNLFCLPSAGSSASMYGEWRKNTPEWLKVFPIEYAGHGGRCNESLASSTGEIIDDILPYILSVARENIILFGHSLGAALAVRLAKKMREIGIEQSVRLMILSGRPAPSCLQSSQTHPSLWSHEELVNRAKRYGGIPEIILNEPDILSFFLHILQNDLCINEELIKEDKVIFSFPIWGMTGEDDYVAPHKSVHQWKEWTNCWKGVSIFPGGHFFLRDEMSVQQIIEGISNILSPLE